jgi:radical SAM protein with 4Fe4S-binding SPASM domain
MCDVGVNYNQSNFFQNLMGSKPINMPVELLKKIIDETSYYFNNTKLGYGFTEPLIYPHLVESLFYAKQKNVYTSLTTNALNLKRYADGLIEGGLEEINISLDGPQDIHNYIRGHKSSFQKAVQGIETLLHYPTPPKISIYCVITEWNIGKLLEFVTFFKDYPLERIGFMHTNFTSDSIAEKHNEKFGIHYPATSSNMQEINIDKMDLDLLWSDMAQLKAKQWQFPVSFSPELKSREHLDMFYHNPEIFIGKRCNDIFHNIMIKSNGDVIPAHGRCYNLTIGNMDQNNLQEIWNSSQISQFRKTVHNAGGLLPACSRCCSGFGK